MIDPSAIQTSQATQIMGNSTIGLMVIYMLVKDVVIPLMKKKEDRDKNDAMTRLIETVDKMAKIITDQANEENLTHRKMLQDTEYIRSKLDLIANGSSKK